MERSMKIIFTLILCFIGFMLICAFLKYLDLKYFEGFWWYLVFEKLRSQDIIPKYRKYIPLRNMLFNIVISVSIFGAIVHTLYWTVKIKRKSN